MKKIIIMADKKEFSFRFVKESNQVFLFNVYKNRKPCIILKILRKILYFFGLKFNNIFYDEWTKFLDDEDAQFILLDDSRPYHRLGRVLKSAKNKPILCFWNKISFKPKKVAKLKKSFEIFSYSKYDCSYFDLKFNPLFFQKSDISYKSTIYDTIFIGQAKNRLFDLERYFFLFDNPYFYVVSNNQKSTVFKQNKKFIDYEEYLLLVLQSKSILEILPYEKAGATIRESEAIVLQKKLITNNYDIINEKYYNPQNIFILSLNTTKNEIIQFLNKEFIPYSEDIVNEFSFTRWLNRF